MAKAREYDNKVLIQIVDFDEKKFHKQCVKHAEQVGHTAPWQHIRYLVGVPS